MIYLYSGTPGSGKSLHTAKTILEKVALGRPVIANIPINLPRIKHGRHRGEVLRKYRKGSVEYWPNDTITPDRLVKYSRDYFQDHHFHEDRILLVIDEAQLMFYARNWNAKGREGWLSFFTQHRHYGFLILLVTQKDRMLDKSIRGLIEYEVVHRKVSNFGLGGALFALVSGGQLFVAIEHWYSEHERISATWFHFHRRYHDIYDSYAIVGETVPVTDGVQGPHLAEGQDSADVPDTGSDGGGEAGEDGQAAAGAPDQETPEGEAEELTPPKRTVTYSRRDAAVLAGALLALGCSMTVLVLVVLGVL